MGVNERDLVTIMLSKSDYLSESVVNYNPYDQWWVIESGACVKTKLIRFRLEVLICDSTHVSALYSPVAK